ILSPANYGEFDRILNDDGILIKVVPGNRYLRELRDIFYDGMVKESYSNDEVIEHYSNNFNILDIQEIEYSKEIDKGKLMHLINMTPLSWSVIDNKIERAAKSDIKNISANFTIIIGQKIER